MFKTKLQGTFLQQLAERRAKWSEPAPSARLVASDDIKWWYWIEYGTVARTIRPNTSKVLVYPSGGVLHFRDLVENYPGIKARHIVEQVNQSAELKQYANERMVEAFGNGGADNLAEIQSAVQDILAEAKRLIVEAYKLEITGTRAENLEYPKQSGKLRGRTAADVFDEQAQVVAQG